MDDITRHKSFEEFRQSSQLSGANAAYLEDLYQQFLENPEQCSDQWRHYFESIASERSSGEEPDHAAIRQAFKEITKQPRYAATTMAPGTGHGRRHEEQQVRVLQLINAYRFRGHQRADTDPLRLREIPDLPELDLDYHGLDQVNQDTVFETGSLSGHGKVKLGEIITRLNKNYCGSIGSEYMHITITEEKRWIQERLEGTRAKSEFTRDEKLRILQRLTAAEGLERYLHTKYVGQKRFSLEGGDSLIPLLDELLHRGGSQGMKELVIGMAHRGRLNVLVNIVGKKPAELFREFEGTAGKSNNGSGDVKYHQGFAGEIKSRDGNVHVSLAFNPSHLEIVGPVVEGSVRARQQRSGDLEGKHVVPVLIHGDAAFAGQGVVMETFNMSQSRGYSTKGTIHIVINNQIGFTTSHQKDARSTLYCTDIAKMVSAPIFHVNADNPEAVIFVTRLALDYRTTFHKDVVIDLVCYRRHGHSEADEPTATQPMMYKAIKDRSTTRAIYAARLEEREIIDTHYASGLMAGYRERVESGDSMVDELLPKGKAAYPYSIDWKPYLQQACTAFLDTSVSQKQLRELWSQLERVPKEFEVNANVAKIFDSRAKMVAGAIPVDWGFAETMAYASLVVDGHSVRLSGQDSGRGTFFHRHAVLHNQQDGSMYVPLQHLSDQQGNFLVINSLLSEEAVLAFEYGYSTTDPQTLVIWEAQFGDFANNAQVVIDQFIAAGEQKWNRLCGLVMFLPHGMEGQGPEHSSARLERYLQLSAEHNIQVCVPTTPAQIFHLIRRQQMLECRKPLIVMTPKSLLRHRLATSSLEELSAGEFQPVIGEIDQLNGEEVTRVILCSGKVYYDLLEKRRHLKFQHIAIVRLERLYPFPEVQLKREIEKYSNAEAFIWCQEEPKNQGAWFSSQHHMRAALPNPDLLVYVGRPFSASPSVGYAWKHQQQQNTLVAEALGLEYEE